MGNLEAVAHEIIEAEILGYREALIGHLEHLDPIQDEHPHLAENFPFLKKLNPTSSSEMGSIQVSKPCNLPVTHWGND